MILTEYVEVVWVSKNIKYYTALGYKYTKLYMKLSEKVRIYEAFFHQINQNVGILLDKAKAAEALSIICDWSYAHRCGNGQLSDKEQDKIINNQLCKMKEYK